MVVIFWLGNKNRESNYRKPKQFIKRKKKKKKKIKKLLFMFWTISWSNQNKKYILVLDGGNIFPVKAITTSHAYLITSNNIYHQFTQHSSLKTFAFLFQIFERTWSQDIDKHNREHQRLNITHALSNYT